MEQPSRPSPSPAQGNELPLTLLLALATLTVCTLCWWYPPVMGVAGISPGGVWFRDTQAVLVAIDMHRLGLDSYSGHYYSHWWYWLGAAGLTPRDRAWVGPVVSGLGLVAGWWMARPRSRAELGWALAVLCSAPVLLGLNRSNVDLLLFALLGGCAPALRSSVRFWRVTGAVALLALGTGLKYYPAFGALILLAIRPARERTLALAVAAILFAMTILSIAPDLVRFAGVVEHAGFYVFGAPTFFAKIGLPASLSLVTASVLLLGAGLWLFRGTALRTWTVPAGLRFDYLNFILGAAILTGCFLLTENYAYRWIYAVMLLPLLGRLDTLPVEPAVRRLKNLTRWLLIGQLWAEPFIVADLNLNPRTQEGLLLWERAGTLVLSGITWALFACLAGWLVHFVATQARVTPDAPAQA